VLELETYHEMLAPLSSYLDLWQTTYLHALSGDDPVVEWTKGSVLGPVLEALEASEREAFLDGYRARVRAAYPRRPDGTTLLPFRRIFLVVTRA
jgi:trans-aconitate 2-methyltransferase